MPGKDPSAELHLPDGLTVRREYENLVLTREAAPAPLEPERLALPGETMAGKWRLTCTAGAYGGQPQGPWDFGWTGRRSRS